MQTFKAKKINQKRTYTVGFSRDMEDLESGSVLTNPIVTASVYDKSDVSDPDPSSILDGAASVNADAATIGGISVPAGQAVLQATKAGIAGCKYVLSFKATRPDGQEVAEDVILPVEKYVPTP